MLCYGDVTYCISPNCVNKCGRKLTKEIRESADKWYKSWVSPERYVEGGAPLYVSCYCGGDLVEGIEAENETKYSKGN